MNKSLMSMNRDVYADVVEFKRFLYDKTYLEA